MLELNIGEAWLWVVPVVCAMFVAAGIAVIVVLLKMSWPRRDGLWCQTCRTYH